MTAPIPDVAAALRECRRLLLALPQLPHLVEEMQRKIDAALPAAEALPALVAITERLVEICEQHGRVSVRNAAADGRAALAAVRGKP